MALDPLQNRRMRHKNPASGDHFRGLDSLIPANTADDDLSVQMAALEKIINAQHLSQLYRGAILQPFVQSFRARPQNRLQKSLHQN